MLAQFSPVAYFKIYISQYVQPKHIKKKLQELMCLFLRTWSFGILSIFWICRFFFHQIWGSCSYCFIVTNLCCLVLKQESFLELKSQDYNQNSPACDNSNKNDCKTLPFVALSWRYHLTCNFIILLDIIILSSEQVCGVAKTNSTGSISCIVELGWRGVIV